LPRKNIYFFTCDDRNWHNKRRRRYSSRAIYDWCLGYGRICNFVNFTVFAGANNGSYSRWNYLGGKSSTYCTILIARLSGLYNMRIIGTQLLDMILSVLKKTNSPMPKFSLTTKRWFYSVRYGTPWSSLEVLNQCVDEKYVYWY